jgi:hypothetical protein
MMRASGNPLRIAMVGVVAAHIRKSELHERDVGPVFTTALDRVASVWPLAPPSACAYFTLHVKTAESDPTNW